MPVDGSGVSYLLETQAQSWITMVDRLLLTIWTDLQQLLSN